jgi:uncharacterized protein (DUF58 family)
MRSLAGIGAFGAVLVLAAGMFDAEPLWVPGTGLVLLAAGLTAALRLAARGARVEREVGAARVVEGEPLTIRVRVHAGLVPLVGGSTSGSDDDLPIARLPAGRRHADGERTIVFARRGRRVLAAPVLVLADPLGLGQRRVSAGAEDAVLVLPRLRPVRALSDGAALALGEDRRGLAPGTESELDGLRPYRPGAPATRIHWPAFARGAGLVERRLQPDADRLPLVARDPSGDVDADQLDAAVRAAASLAVALGRDGGCAVLLPGDRRPTALDSALAGWPALHARFAVVAPGPAPVLAAHLQRHRSILYVAARAPRRLPATLGSGPRGPRVLVVPGLWAGGPQPVFEVAGCHGYAIGVGARERAA